MAKRQGGWLLAKTLQDLGTDTIFTLGGGHINPVYKACSELGIRLIDTRHEQGASMAADAYGRIMRKPGVCLVTAGPGFTNTLTSLSVSYLANSPLLVIAGRSGVEENDRLSLQEIDQMALASPVTKWARTVYDVSRIPEYVNRAYRICITGKPGPVYLGMSYEVLYPFIEGKKVQALNTDMTLNRVAPPEDTIVRFAETLSGAKNPVVIAGSGAWYSGSESVLKEFSDLLGIPVFTLNMARGIVPDNENFGSASGSSPRGFREISAESDLVLLLGARMSIYAGFGKSINKNAKIVQVDIDADEIGRNISVDLAINSDITSFLSKCVSYIRDNGIDFDFSKWMEKAVSLKNSSFSKFHRDVLSCGSGKIHPAQVANKVSEFARTGDVIVVDGGDSQSWSDITCEINTPGGYLKGGLLGCMGVGIPFALGAKSARTGESVFLITGDGAAGMNFMEIDTALRHDLPVIVVICNDSSWGMTRHQIDITYPNSCKVPGVDLGFTPFHQIALSMGAYGEAVFKVTDLLPAIERALSSGLPSVINVETDPDAVSAATEFITSTMTDKM